MHLHCPDPEATARAARALGRALRRLGREGRGVTARDGLVLALIGPLGAGKTWFVKGLAEGLGLDPAVVSSPTFVIVHQYEAADTTLAHVDLYRVGSVAELDAAGFADLLGPGAVVAVEWADRLPQALPADRLELRLARDPGARDSRRLSADATGKGSHELLRVWREELGAAGLAPDA